MNLPISTPPLTQLGKRLTSLIRKANYDFSLFSSTDKILVALSGGKDSLSLLYLLKGLVKQGFPHLEISACHVKGKYSCGAGVQESFIKAICHRLSVPLYIKESNNNTDKLECYSCSRNRRKLLFETAKEYGTQLVAFGHHRDDSIETLLLNLFHKGEFEANLAKVPMIRYGVTIIRPLIYASEDDIVQFAKQGGFSRITCQCPVGQNSKRKQVKQIIKEIEDAFPHVKKNLERSGLKYGLKKALSP